MGLRRRTVSTYLRVDQTILRASNEDEALNLEEIGEFRWIKFPHTDGVALFLSLSQKFPYPRNQRKVRGWTANR